MCIRDSFKGTQKRHAWHILNRMENVGGDLNAYTNKEETVIYLSLIHIYFVLLCKLIHILKPSYQVSVRQTRCLPIPTHEGHPCRWLYASRYQGTWGDLHPLEYVRSGRT